MKKTTYLVVGGIVLICAGTMTFWFYEDVLHLFTDPSSYTSQVRTFGLIASWIFGIACFWYGLKSERINKLSNTSIILIVATLVLSTIFAALGCNTIGGICSGTEVLMSNLSRWVFVYGIGLGILLMISSLFTKKRI